jgi:hypothetical protein
MQCFAYRSAGGNDVELVNTLNQCVYQWCVLNPEQVAIAKAAVLLEPDKYEWAEGFDFDALGRGCADQLKRSGSILESEEFSRNLDTVIKEAKNHLDLAYVAISSLSPQGFGLLHWAATKQLMLTRKQRRYSLRHRVSFTLSLKTEHYLTFSTDTANSSANQ